MRVVFGLGAAFVLLAVLALLPVRLQVKVLWAGKLEVSARIAIGPVQLSLPPLGRKGRSRGKQPTRASSQKRGKAAAVVLMRKTALRRFLVRCVHLEQLELRALVATGDAARTALLSGAIGGTLSLLPMVWREKAVVCIQPDFFSGHTRAQGMCMIYARMGMLLTGAIWLALACQQQQRRQKAKR